MGISSEQALTLKGEGGRFVAVLPERGTPEESRLLDMVAEGRWMSEIAKTVGVTRRALYHWIKRDPEREAEFEAARAASAEAHVREAARIGDVAAKARGLTSAQAQIAKERAGHRRWMAEKLDRSTYGGTAAVQVNVGVGELHLQALEKYGHRGVTAPEIVEAEAEVIEEDETDEFAAMIDELTA